MNIRSRKYRLLILVPLVIALVYLLVHFHETNHWLIEPTNFFEAHDQSDDRNETTDFPMAVDDVFGENASVQRGKSSPIFTGIQHFNGSRVFNLKLSDAKLSHDSTPKTLPKHSVIETAYKKDPEGEPASKIVPIPASSMKKEPVQEVFKLKSQSYHDNNVSSTLLPTSRAVTLSNSVEEEEFDEYSASSPIDDNSRIPNKEFEKGEILEIPDTTPIPTPTQIESFDKTKTENLTKIILQEPIDYCPYEPSISNKLSTVRSNCQVYFEYFDPCKEALPYYDEKVLKHLPKCSRKQNKPICYFKKNVSTDQMNESNINCSNEVCANGNPITIGMFDETNGKMKFTTVTDVAALKAFLIHLNGTTDFIFVTCKLRKLGKRKTQQLIKFPPKILSIDKTARTKSISPINVNVFVIDSLSRQHFYRILLNTVKAMKEINLINPTKILDFRAFQSLAPFTFVNLHAFFSGSVSYESVATRRYNFEDLFSKFQQGGYQTMLQEDTCWYDQWGSLLTGNSKLKSKADIYHQKIWDDIKNNTTPYQGIDSLGMTHISCEILSQYGHTNLFNSKSVACLNGKPMSTYFIQQIIDHLRARASVRDAKPLFSYTHINFAHEISGVRIKVLDTELANFITFLSQAEDTVSILWSDHGGKTNQYSMDTLSGRFEVYDPFLFMVVPQSLKSILSKEDFQQLLNNQEALFTPLDLRATILDILNQVNVYNNNNNNKNNNKNIRLKFKGSLISTNLASRRNCSFLPTRNYSLCKCINELTFPVASDPQYKDFLGWLAEFAIGSINNKLTNQQVGSKRLYKCKRVIGISIDKVILRTTANGNVYIFDIIVNSKAGNKDIFNVHVFHNAKRMETMPLLKLTFWQRISFYSRYKSCTDPMVSIELCICANRQTITFNKNYLASYTQFGAMGAYETIGKSSCLFLIKRDQDVVVSYEVANFCKEEKVITFRTDVLYSWEVAEDLPLKITIGPSKMKFITTFYKLYKADEPIGWKIEVA